MARAIRIHETGGSDVLRLEEIDDPTPGPGQAVVAVAAAGVNFVDIYERSGAYDLDLPATLGSEAAGTVAAVGEGVGNVQVGDRVAWAQQRGAYASATAVAADALVPVPDGVDFETAAAVMLQGMTAHYLVRSTYPLRDGETALVHAAAGGVGALLVQLAKDRGARVIATASTEDKRAIAREAGADDVLDYGSFREAAQAAGGAHVVYDGVGKSTFDDSMASLRPRGYLVLFGASSGQVPPVDPQRLNRSGSLFLTRPTLKDYIATPEELRWRAGELFEAVQSGRLRVRIGARYPLADAARAHEDLAGRRTTGKLLLIP